MTDKIFLFHSPCVFLTSPPGRLLPCPNSWCPHRKTQTKCTALLWQTRGEEVASGEHSDLPKHTGVIQYSVVNHIRVAVAPGIQQRQSFTVGEKNQQPTLLWHTNHPGSQPGEWTRRRAGRGCRPKYVQGIIHYSRGAIKVALAECWWKKSELRESSSVSLTADE